VIDKALLLAWLRERSNRQNALIASVYQGLADRVERGDFDTREDEG
jgi:hypothetical protein